MYSLIKLQPARRLIATQLPSLAGALLVAEVFYKFHSFSLECLAFLGTWAAFDYMLSRLIDRSPSS